MVERGGKVRTMTVETRRKPELECIVRTNIAAGSIFSDALKSYEGLADTYKHAVMDHALEYVNGKFTRIPWRTSGAY